MNAAVRIHHLGFSVLDLDLAIDMARALGFEVTARIHLGGADMARGNDLPGARAEIAWMQYDSLVLELLDFAEKARPSGPGAQRARARLAIHDPDRTFAHLRDIAGRFAGSAILSAPNGILAYAGLAIEAEAAGRGGAVRPTIISPVVDVERASDLLVGLGFALSPGERRFESDELIVEFETTSNYDSISPPPNRIGRLHVAVEVASIERFHASLGAAGFSFVSPPIRSEGPIWWMFIREPLGMGLELIDITTG